jgi:hypothetical protein
MSPLNLVFMLISFGASLFAFRELKILAEGDIEPYQIVRAACLIVMTICPYFLPEPWNSVIIGLGLAGLIVSIFLKPREIF